MAIIYLLHHETRTLVSAHWSNPGVMGQTQFVQISAVQCVHMYSVDKYSVRIHLSK